MNKEERLHRLFGDIDDELVADAARKPIRKAVWVPAVAAAACVALTVGLWQGGVFDPAPIPVETPDEGATTTGETTEPYILVGGEEDSSSLSNSSIPSLNDRLVSPALEAKMKEYRDVNAVFQVVVFSAITVEDEDECDNFVEADKEYQSLLKQYKEAKKAEKKASDRLHESRVNNDDPEIQAVLLEEYLKAEEVFNDLSHKRHMLREELWEKYYDTIEKERISYAAKYSKTEPIYGYGRFGTGYYMELTADAINELADRGGYDFNLAGEKTKEYEVADA
ncbi:MAG: hypothetical protein IJO42_02525 [Clostridia bacterium]|nr:hypothetical protein [Clostridia bacterium]